MHIVYCIDAAALPLFRMSAASVRKFNPGAEITVVSTEPLDTGDIPNLVVPLPEVEFRHTPGDRLSDATYLRIFLPEFLPGLNRVLYLDADTLCTGPLDDLWAITPDYLAATHSHDYGIKQAQQIGIDSYCLDSVLLMNLKALRKTGFVKNFIAAMLLAQFPRTNFYCAETILNVCFRELIQPLDLKWNYCHARRYSQYPDAITESEAKILHFIGPDKSPMKAYFASVVK